VSKFDLVLLIHAHQPIGNFDDVMERTYEQSYLPFVECLARHPGVRMGLHYSGSLLEWLAERHPEYIHRVSALAVRSQVEVVGGGFYEPILVTIPPEDQLEQIRRLSDFVERHFGKRPSGAWLAERVWEPQVPAVLAGAGIEYTLVDDSHFLMAGHELPELYGYYVAEERGATVKVIPGLQELRYLLPFRSVDDAIGFLRGAAAQHPGGMAAMGDDMEKFGGWPHTWEHCYRDGWVDKFFEALEANQDWLETIPPGEALAARQPLGRADLPTASYTEMMEWVLPTTARQRFRALQDEFASRPEVRRFLRGGFWRGFFSKYAEANLLHKKMLRVSSKIRKGGANGGKPGPRSAKAKAITHLLRAQCNDAYWHGIFGGLYSPHLRTALWRELVRAETIAEATRRKTGECHNLERLDFDADGREEIEITSPQQAALLKPSDGGTLMALDFRPRAVTLINSLQRRVEAYHSRVREAVARAPDRVASIHDRTVAKEAGLEQLLRYDRWPRHAFRLLLFDVRKTHQNYELLQLGESAAFAGGDYQVEEAATDHATLWFEGPLEAGISESGQGRQLRARKKFTFSAEGENCEAGCSLELEALPGETTATRSDSSLRFMVGLEVILNLLAPSAPDRFFEFPGNRHELAWSGVVAGAQLRIVDEWQDVAVELQAHDADKLWVAPIETISESEEGFERVYQGSQILALWPAELAIGERWNAGCLLHIRPAREANPARRN
jgi:4-alpha-glucanotransferase